MNDLERLTSKMNSQRANARDVKGLGQSLKVIPDIIESLEKCNSQLLCKFRKDLEPLEDIVGSIEKAIVDDPPVSITEGGLFRDGFDADLDELLQISRHGKQWILDLQSQ